MYSFFAKKYIFLKVAGAIVLLFLADSLVLLVLGKTTEGKVIEYVYNNAGGSKYPSIKYPVIQFQVKEKVYKFNGNWDANYYKGDTVKVVYRPWWPNKAKICTFWGVTKRPLIQFAIVFVLWFMIYSSFRPTVRKEK